MILLLVKVPVTTGRREEFIQRAQHAIIESRREKGNISYNLYKSVENDNDVLYVEEWKDEEALAEHCKAEYFLSFRIEQEELGLVSGERERRRYEVAI